MPITERYLKVMEVLHEQAREKALSGQVLTCTNGTTKELDFRDLEDLPIFGTTLGNYLSLLNQTIDTLKKQNDLLIDVINTNQEATTNAIDDIRNELEKGRVF